MRHYLTLEVDELYLYATGKFFTRLCLDGFGKLLLDDIHDLYCHQEVKLIVSSSPFQGSIRVLYTPRIPSEHFLGKEGADLTTKYGSAYLPFQQRRNWSELLGVDHSKPHTFYVRIQTHKEGE